MEKRQPEFKEVEQITYDTENGIYQMSYLPDLLLRYGEIKERESDGSLNQPIGMFVEGEIDFPRLEKSLQKIIDEEDSLRAYTFEKNGKYFIKVRDEAKFKLENIIVEGNTLEEKTEKSLKLAADKAAELIDIFDENGFVFKIVSFEVSAEKHLLLLVGQHLFFDTSTLVLFLWIAFKYYEDENFAREKSAPYQEFMKEEMEFFFSPEASKQKAYWEEKMKGYEPISFDLDLGRKVETSSDVAKYTINQKRATEIARENRTSLFNVIMLIVHMAIAKIHHVHDTVTVYAFSNRAEEKYRNTFGFIARTVTNRLIFDDEDTITALHKKMRKEIADGYKNYQYSQLSFGKIGHIVAYEEVGTSAPKLVFNGKEVQMIPIDVTRENANFLCVMVMEGNGDEMEIYLETDTQFVSRAYLQEMRDNCLLAEKFIYEYPEKKFSDFMRADITIDTLDLLQEESTSDFISI